MLRTHFSGGSRISQRRTPTPKGDANLLFDQLFSENCMEMNKESLTGGARDADPMHFTCWEAAGTLLLPRRLRSYCEDGEQPAGSGCVTSAAEAPPGTHVRAHAQCRRRPDCTAGSAWRTSLLFSGTPSYSDLKCTSVDG